MKRKLRIFSSIAVICLSVCMFAFGVYAANQVSVTTSGTVTFSASGVYAKVTGGITGNEGDDITFSELTFNSDNADGDSSTWANNVSFDSNNEITLTISVQNLATDRALYATLYDIDQPEKLGTTMKVGESDYLSSTVTEVAANGTTTFTITMTPKDLNSSFTVDYEYLLDLDSEKLNADRIESKIKTGVNNSEMGSIVYSLDESKTQLTLTATTTGSSNFLGFVSGSANDGRFVYARTASTTLNLNFIDARAFYAVFYTSVEDKGDGYECYVGSTYARYNVIGGVSTTTGGILETVEYNGVKYNVAMTGSSGGGDSFLDDSVVSYVIPSHISLIYDYGSAFGGSLKNVVISENVFYIVEAYPWSAQNINIYIDSKTILAQFNYEDLYRSSFNTCGNWYINEKLVEYLEYNPFFEEYYEKSANTTEYNGQNYYYYQYEIPSPP